MIAGLLGQKRGVEYVFSPLQLTQFEDEGACWKDCYLPDGAPSPKDVEISFNGKTKAEIKNGGDGGGGDMEGEREVPSMIYNRLNNKYVDECCDESELDIKIIVSSSSSLPAEEANSRPLPPFLVVHGDAYQNAPFHNDEELFSATSESMSFLPIPLNAILEHTRTDTIKPGHIF